MLAVPLWGNGGNPRLASLLKTVSLTEGTSATNCFAFRAESDDWGSQPPHAIAEKTAHLLLLTAHCSLFTVHCWKLLKMDEKKQSRWQFLILRWYSVDLKNHKDRTVRLTVAIAFLDLLPLVVNLTATPKDATNFRLNQNVSCNCF